MTRSYPALEREREEETERENVEILSVVSLRSNFAPLSVLRFILSDCQACIPYAERTS